MRMPTFDVSGPSSRGSAVFIDGYTISDQQRRAAHHTHNEMGLPVDVLSEKREMQV